MDEDGPPPAPDRVVLDVGGVKFTSSVHTLSSHSAYFHARLSGNWRKEEVFVDQDPKAFAKLLSYMRQGTIDVDEIDKDVVLLAEFLQIETLLVAVKARVYRNLNPGLDGSQSLDDGEAAREFDVRHGGIRKALSDGILLISLKKQPSPKQDFALLTLTLDVPGVGIQVKASEGQVELHKQDVGRGIGNDGMIIVGALNWLHHHGYTKHEGHLDKTCGKGPDIRGYLEQPLVTTMAFSRRVSSPNNGTDVFLPEEKKLSQPEDENMWRKEFVMVTTLSEQPKILVHCKAAHDPESRFKDQPSATCVSEDGAWLETHGFLNREMELEKLLEKWIPAASMHPFQTYQIFSRRVEYLASETNESGLRMNPV